MTVAYHGGYEFRPAKEYFLKMEKDRQMRKARWAAQDAERLDELFNRFTTRDDVDRDEEKIAEILNNAEKRAYEEHQRLLDSHLTYTTPTDYLGTSRTKLNQRPRKRFDLNI